MKSNLSELGLLSYKIGKNRIQLNFSDNSYTEAVNLIDNSKLSDNAEFIFFQELLRLKNKIDNLNNEDEKKRTFPTDDEICNYKDMEKTFFSRYACDKTGELTKLY